MTIVAIYRTPDLHGECFVRPLKRWCKVADEHLTGILKIGYLVHAILGLLAGVGMLVKCVSTIRFKPDAEALDGLKLWNTWLKGEGKIPEEKQYPKQLPDGYKLVTDTQPLVLRKDNLVADEQQIVQTMNGLKQANLYRKMYITFQVQDARNEIEVWLFVATPN